MAAEKIPLSPESCPVEKEALNSYELFSILSEKPFVEDEPADLANGEAESLPEGDSPFGETPGKTEK